MTHTGLSLLRALRPACSRLLAAGGVLALAVGGVLLPGSAADARPVDPNGVLASSIPAGSVPPPSTRTTTAPSLGSTGALPVGQAAYPVPAGAIFVAPQGADDNAGTQAKPLRSVEAAIARASAGGTIVLRAGTYHQRFTVTKPLTIQNYPGEAVWFDGSQVVTGFSADGTAWRKDGWTTRFDSSASFSRGSDAGGFVNSRYPMAAHPDQVWIDGRPLQQVGSRSAVTQGTFFVDYANQRLFVGSNPAGGTVRASTIGRAIEVRAEGTVLRGFGVRRYAPSVPDMGTVTLERPRATAENLHLVDNATTGISLIAQDITVRRLTVQRNGMLGIHANHSDRLRMEHVRATDNNTEHFNRAPVSGGIKITRARGVSLDRATLTGNDGPGYWLDESVVGGRVTNSVLKGNAGHGMSLEISADMFVAGNLIRDNGHFGIKINNTSNVEVWNNTIVGNDRPVNIVQDDRRGSNLSTPGHDPRYPGALDWINGPVNVRNNVLSADTGNCLLCVEDYSHQFTAEQFKVTTNNNVYQRDTASQPQWVAVWSRGPGDPAVFRDLASFRSATGQEATSLNLLGTAAVDDQGRVTSTVRDAAAKTAAPLPSSVADALGLPVSSRVLGAPFSAAVTSVSVNRQSGDNRYETAALLASTYSKGVGVAYVASGTDYPDALTGAPLAGRQDAPVLLTRQDGLPDATRAALSQLAPQSIVVLGGESAVSSAVETSLGDLTSGPVTRISGGNRYETAAELARTYGKGLGVVYVASGTNFPDALTGAPLAGKQDAPILLTRQDELPEATRAALSQLAPKSIVVLGGPAAVSSAVEQQLRGTGTATVTRISGADRYDTSATLTSAYPTGVGVVYIASGTTFPDALSGAPVAGRQDAPVLITRPGDLPDAVRAALTRLEPKKVVILGGEAAVSATVERQVRDIVGR